MFLRCYPFEMELLKKQNLPQPQEEGPPRKRQRIAQPSPAPRPATDEASSAEISLDE